MQGSHYFQITRPQSLETIFELYMYPASPQASRKKDLSHTYILYLFSSIFIYFFPCLPRVFLSTRTKESDQPCKLSCSGHHSTQVPSLPLISLSDSVTSHYQAWSRTPISRTCRTLQKCMNGVKSVQSRLVDLWRCIKMLCWFSQATPDPDDHDTGARRQLLVAALLSIPQYVSIHRHSNNNFLLIPCTWLTMLTYVKMLLHFRSTGSIRKYNTTKAMGHQSLSLFF